MNALFTPLDMTDYENTFVGFNEIGGALPINSPSLLKPVIEEPWPANHALVAIEALEKRPKYARSKIHRELLETKAAEEEAAADHEEEEEEGEEEGSGEEAEGEEAPAEDESDLPEEPEYPPVE